MELALFCTNFDSMACSVVLIFVEMVKILGGNFVELCIYIRIFFELTQQYMPNGTSQKFALSNPYLTDLTDIFVQMGKILGGIFSIQCIPERIIQKYVHLVD